MAGDFVQQLADEFRGLSKSTSWTGIKHCKAGNGENPPQVWILDTDSPDGNFGWLWCYRVIDQTKEVFMVKNLSASLSYSEEIAGSPVTIGYPPQSETLCVYTDDAAEHKGLLKSQIATLEAAAVTADKFAMMVLRAQNSLVLQLLGGFWRLGNRRVWAESSTTFLDVTAYIPSTSGKARWIHVAVNTDSDPVVTMGQIYSAASLTPGDYIPLSVDERTLSLAWVKLVNGVTALTQREILPAPDIFFVPDRAGSDSAALYLALRAAKRR